MAIQLLFGDSGVGKTHYIYSELIERSMKDINKNFVMIVPEQFTMHTQQEIIDKHDNSGIMNIEVLSFGRLAYRIYDDLMVSDKKMLNEPGKGMVIRKILEEHRDDYKIISKNIHRKGYINEVQDILKEVYQYDLNEEDFERIYAHISSPLLQDKIKDINKLYNAFNTYISEQYITTETTMDLLAQSIASAKFLENTDIYIDGFYGFTPIQYKIISELSLKCNNVMIAITISEEALLDEIDNSNLFYESRKIVDKIQKISNDLSVEYKQPILIKGDIPYRYKDNQSLNHILNNLFKFKKYNKIKASGIYMCDAKNMQKEIDFVADSITKLVMEKGYRYKDIAILSGDIVGYEKLITELFKQYEIPYFIDTVKDIIHNPFVELILNLLDIFNSRYSYESVVRYLRNGLLNLDEERLDMMENYAIAYGIKGKKRWVNNWEYPYPYLKYDENEALNEAVMKEINSLKDGVLDSVTKLHDRINGKKTVREICIAIYDYMEEIKLYEAIEGLENRFLEEGDVERSLEYGQIYKTVIELFDQMVEILGDMEVNVNDFKKLLETGIIGSELKIVPPSFDQVTIGDIERSRIRDVKALFVIGLNEGKIPKVSNKTSIITDRERLKLKEIDIELAPDNKTNLYKEQFFIYMALLRTKERLYLSYAKSNSDGSSMMPSMLFYSINKMFEGLKIYSIEQLYQRGIVINKPVPTIHRILYQIANHCPRDSDFNEAINWFLGNDRWKNSIINPLKALEETNDARLKEGNLIDTIYGKELSSSISRLELFTQCPFAHYVKYGLDLSERREYEIRADNIGILLHKAINLFFEEVVLRDIDYNQINQQLINEVVDHVIEVIVKEDENGLFKSSFRTQYIVTRLKRITIRAISVMLYQINKGSFSPKAFEYAFNGNNKGYESLKIELDEMRSMNIKGQIDRIDEFETDDTLYLSVVDYKSSNKDLDMNAVYYGLQLQLLVYLNAAIKIKKGMVDKDVVPAAALYFYMNNPMIKDASSREVNQIEDKIRKELKLKGIVLSDEEVIKHLDNTIESKSDVIPVSFKKDGNFTSSSPVLSKDEFVALQSFIDVKTKKIGKEIVRGNIKINPYKYKSQKGCDYCDYHAICRFEQGINHNVYNEFNKMSKDELWEKINEDINENS